MTTGYFAQVTDGVVTAVHKVSREYMDENPDLYPGLWVEVISMDNYPAVDWTWTPEGGFMPPPDPLDETPE